MVKKVRVLDAVMAEEADRPYEETDLARRAPAARKRLTALVLLVAAALVLEAALRGNGLWLVPALFTLGAALLLHKKRLGGLLASGFVALLCTLLPPVLFAMGARDTASVLTMGIAFVFGVACLPDLVLLVRDAELQHAYGLWARRKE